MYNQMINRDILYEAVMLFGGKRRCNLQYGHSGLDTRQPLVS